MFYDVKIRQLQNKGDLKAYASVTFGGCLTVRGIKIYESDGKVKVDMPKVRNNRKNELGDYVERLIAVPKKEFAKEFFKNIEKVYLNQDDKSADNRNDEFKYSITFTPYSSGGNVLGVANICIEDSFLINGFTIMNGKNGVFVNNPKIFKDDEYKDIAFPITSEFRTELYDNILGISQKNLTEDEQKIVSGLSHKKTAYLNQIEQIDNMLPEAYDKFKNAKSSNAEDTVINEIGTLVVSKYELSEKISLIEDEINRIMFEKQSKDKDLIKDNKRGGR